MPCVTGAELYRYCRSYAATADPAVMPGMHAAILGGNSAAWLTLFFCVCCSGSVAVPLHLATKDDELFFCIQKADCSILYYDRSCEKRAAAIREHFPSLQLREFHEVLSELRDTPVAELAPLEPDAPCAFFFTSGTLSMPKCVMLTNRNFGTQVTAVMNAISLSSDDVSLSVLPPSHTFEISTNITGALHCGGTLYINSSIRNMKRDLREIRPTIIIAVPLMLQTLKKEILAQARKTGRLSRLERGLALNSFLQRFGIDLSKRLFPEVSAVFGGRLRYFIVGGASVPNELIRFFGSLGITVIQGYGITECSPVVSIDLPQNEPGSVGRTIGSCETRIIDGEICVRGDSVSPGYYKDEEGTAEAFAGGWFHTGDLGHKDDKSFLWFDGRKNNLIVLPNGENVSSESIEDRLYALEGVLDAIVYDSGGMITAEIYADSEAIPGEREMWAKILEVNRGLADYQRIQKLVLRHTAFEKTATQKIKRRSGEEV